MQGYTPLMHVARSSTPEIVQQLLSNGANVSIQGTEARQSCLACHVQHARPAVLTDHQNVTRTIAQKKYARFLA